MKRWHTGNRTEDPWHSPNTTYNCTVRAYCHFNARTYIVCFPSRPTNYHRLRLLTPMFPWNLTLGISTDTVKGKVKCTLVQAL